MRNIILDLAISLDGFIEGPNGETDWCILDDDMGFDTFLERIDTILYGRVSYDLWGNYQPEATEDPAMQQFWASIHSKEKYVFSSQPRQDERATFIHTHIKEAVDAIRQQPGKDIWLYGGAKLIKTFIDLDLVDIYRLSVHPVALGTGKPLFLDLQQRLQLQLKNVNKFRSGVVQLEYENKGNHTDSQPLDDL
jgi:dihydrofolate reductase